MNAKILQRLIWKDAKSIQPLMIAGALAAIVLNGLLFLVFGGGDYDDGDLRITLSYVVWILLPNLVAFGAPAMLIGTEHESGSLAWLRTLPAKWQSVSAAKLIVVMGAIVAMWILCSLIFSLQWSFSDASLMKWLDHRGKLPSTQALPVVTQVVFSLTLGMVSLCTAYLFRSPITALLSVLPVMVGMAFTFAWISEELTLNRGAARLGTENSTNTSLAFFVAIMTFVLLVTGVCHQWVARRRLSGSEETIKERVKQRVSNDGFRPPRTAPATWYGSTLVHPRPTPRRALLWQNMRQLGAKLIVLAGVGMLGAILCIREFGRNEEWGIILLTISLFGLAGLTFYGDSVRKRCVFLYDRGVSHGLIWRTRLFPTGVAVAAILISACVFSMSTWAHGETVFTLITMVSAGFALCQLVSQWSPRPIFAFMAGPVFVAIVLLILTPLLERYETLAVLSCWLMVPVLLFASRRLMPRWLSGEIDRGYASRFFGFLFVAIVLPYASIIGYRVSTIPAENTQWRTQALAYESPRRAIGEEMIHIAYTGASKTSTINSPWILANFVVSAESRNFETRFEKEMQSESIVGSEVSLAEVTARIPSWPSAQYEEDVYGPIAPSRLQYRSEELRMVRLLLKWSGMVRDAAIHGEASFYELTHIAEQGELIAAVALEDRIKRDGMNDEIRELIAMFPSDDVVLQSRRNSLIAAWKSFAKRIDLHAGFSGAPRLKKSRAFDWFEIPRRDRYVDQTVMLAEQQWRDGNPKGLWEMPECFQSATQCDLVEVFGVLVNEGNRDRVHRLKNRLR